MRFNLMPKRLVISTAAVMMAMSMLPHAIHANNPSKPLKQQKNQSPKAPLPVGSKAPAFSLQATGDTSVSLSDYAGKNLIIVFYPMDQTPGCTVQLCALRDEYQRFKKLNTEIVASNPADLESHLKFAKKQNYVFPILVDKDRLMAKAYGVKSFAGINSRTVFIVDTKGVIRFSDEGMPSPDELAAAIKAFK